jgi:hypothetical protein
MTGCLDGKEDKKKAGRKEEEKVSSVLAHPLYSAPTCIMSVLIEGCLRTD